jgi:hypothetical protein
MNFRTTFILMLVLIGAVTFFIVASRDTEESTPVTQTDAKGRKLLDLKADQVDKIVISPAQGAPAGSVTVELSKSADGEWNFTKPFNWRAASFEVGSFVNQLLDMRVRSTLPLSAENNPTTGLDKPRYRVQFSGPGGKSATLAIGNRSPIGNDLYVIANNEKEGSVVAGTLNEKFDKGLAKLADTLRDKQLLRLTSSQIKQVEINRGGKKLVLHKLGEEWKVIAPTAMPADSGEVNTLLSSITGIRADEFADETAAASSGSGLDKPRITVTLSSVAPATQPTTQPTAPPAGSTTVLTFGQPTDIEGEKIWVKVSEPASVAKASFTQASLDKLLTATPLALRDRKVLTIDPEKVTKLSLNIEKAATTQPTTREASTSSVVLERTKQQMGPVEPTTAPATMAAIPTTGEATTQASTQPASQPVEPPSKWNLASKGGADADDVKVDDLLRELNPLRVDKYNETTPATQPSATVTLTIETTDARHEIRFIDPGEGKALTGAYNGLSFEVPRSILDKMEADFNKTKPPGPVGPVVPLGPVRPVGPVGPMQ